MAAHPYSRPVQVLNLSPDGLTLTLTTEAVDRAAIATALDLPAVHQAGATFTLMPRKPGEVHVSGLVRAELEQVCVVSLDPFPVTIEEAVDLEFATEDALTKWEARQPATRIGEQRPDASHELEEIDPPDPIVNGTIDLGALMVEFIALGLDPFPRKPGVTFDYQDEQDRPENPFAKLAALKGDDT